MGKQLFFPNGTEYPGPTSDDGSTNPFELTIDGKIYKGQFSAGLFTGTILLPSDGILFGTIDFYDRGKKIQSYGIDEDGIYL